MTTPIEDIPVKTITGEPSSLGHHSGKVRLVVNVASKCGLTPQYNALEAIYRQYKDKGFAVLGFPANEFGGQEPGTEGQIQSFCAMNFDVTFPMFSKIVVKGAGQHPLYAALTQAQPTAQTVPGTDFREQLESYGLKPGGPTEVLWNFEKFLVNRKGEVVERFSPDMTPDSEPIKSAIERELAKA